MRSIYQYIKQTAGESTGSRRHIKNKKLKLNIAVHKFHKIPSFCFAFNSY